MLTEKQKSEGWRIVKFGDVARECKEKVDRESNPFERYVAGGDMDSESLVIRRWGVFGNDYVGPAFHRVFRKGQILYGSRRTYLKKVAIADFDGVTANTTFVIEQNENSFLAPGLLPYIMLSDDFTRHSIENSKGSTNPYIVWSDIAKYEFSLPPRPRQEQIVVLLAQIDKTIKLSEELSDQAHKLLHTAISQIGLGNSLVAETLLSDLGYVYSGLSGKKGSDFKDGNSFFIPYINVFRNFSVDLNELEKVKISKGEKQNTVEAGDVIFTISSEIPDEVGMSSVLLESNTSSLYLNSFCVGFRPYKNTLIAEFSKYYFRSAYFRKKISALAQGSTRFNISRIALGKIKLQIPDANAQKSIAVTLDNFEQTHLISVKKLSNLIETKRRLLSEILK